MESSQTTQSLVSLGLTLLIAGMLRSPADPLPGGLNSGPWSSGLDCYLYATPMAHWEVPVWHYMVCTGPKCVHRRN